MFHKAMAVKYGLRTLQIRHIGNARLPYNPHLIFFGRHICRNKVYCGRLYLGLQMAVAKLMTINTSSIELAREIALQSSEETDYVCVEATIVIHIQRNDKRGCTVPFQYEIIESGTSILFVVNSIAKRKY